MALEHCIPLCDESSINRLIRSIDRVLVVYLTVSELGLGVIVCMLCTHVILH